MSDPHASHPADAGSSAGPGAAPASHVVLVYSDDPAVRGQITTSVGRRPAADLGRVEWVECATGPEVVARLDRGGIDLAVLDGEAWPTGGMGLARQAKDEIADCPPTLVLVARKDDRWLAEWSMADAVVSHPVDPGLLTDAVVEQLRRRASRVPVRRYR